VFESRGALVAPQARLALRRERRPIGRCRTYAFSNIRRSPPQRTIFAVRAFPVGPGPNAVSSADARLPAFLRAPSGASGLSGRYRCTHVSGGHCRECGPCGVRDLRLPRERSDPTRAALVCRVSGKVSGYRLVDAGRSGRRGRKHPAPLRGSTGVCGSRCHDHGSRGRHPRQAGVLRAEMTTRKALQAFRPTFGRPGQRGVSPAIACRPWTRRRDPSRRCGPRTSTPGNCGDVCGRER